MRDDSILPDLGASDVLVRAHAVGVNPLDMRVNLLHVDCGSRIVEFS